MYHRFLDWQVERRYSEYSILTYSQNCKQVLVLLLGMIKAWDVVLDLECFWRITIRDYENDYENNGVAYNFVLYYSECLLGVLSVFVGAFLTGRGAGSSTMIWREAVSLACLRVWDDQTFWNCASVIQRRTSVVKWLWEDRYLNIQDDPKVLHILCL